MEELRAQLADALWHCGAVKINTTPGEGFRLALHDDNPTAPLTPLYISLRAPGYKDGTLTPKIFAQAGQLMCDVWLGVKDNTTIFAAVPEAGNSFGDAVITAAEKRGLHYGLIKMQKGQDADDKRTIDGIASISGEFRDSQKRIVGIDDLNTRAVTKLLLSRWFEKHTAYTISHFLVLIDREQGGREELARAGITLLAVFTLTELLEYYEQRGLITADALHTIRTYLSENN